MVIFEIFNSYFYVEVTEIYFFKESVSGSSGNRAGTSTDTWKKIMKSIENGTGTGK